MKRLLIYMGAFFFFFSCSDKEGMNLEQQFEVVFVNHSDCLGTKSAPVDASGDEQYVVSALGEGHFLIEHSNSYFNCCLPEGIEITCYRNQDTLFYGDREKVPGNCKCICLYSTETEIAGIEEGDYVLCFLKEGVNVGSTEISFHDQLNETILVSDL